MGQGRRDCKDISRGKPWLPGGAECAARLGESGQAFLWLEQAIGQRAPWLVYDRFPPVYDNLPTDPRFGKAWRQIGF